MTLFTTHAARVLTASLAALTLAACNGDDAATSATDGDSSTTEESTSTSMSTTTPTSGMSVSESDGTMSGTMSGTATMGTTDSTTTDGTTDSTTTGVDTDPTTTTTTTTTTTGDAECGNGIQEPGEACDDGNLDPGDGCEPDCTETPMGECGDGVVDPGEQCDDGNTMGGDGCSASCKNEGGGLCPQPDDYLVCDDGQNPTWSQAFGIGCSDDPKVAVVITDASMNSNSQTAWKVAKGFGTYHVNNDPNMPLLYSPREGAAFLIVSTGDISNPNAQGIVTEEPGSQINGGDNGNDDSDNLPAPMSHLRGSNNGMGGTPFMNCDGVNDCSDTLYDQWLLGFEDPNDKLHFTFKAQVPDLVESYSFNFAYFSSEWPDYVDSPFNDLFIAWQVSEVYTGNVTFIGDAPLTVTALDPYLSTDGFTYDEPQLQGTGFDGDGFFNPGNAGSDWFAANQNVMPGEVLHMTFFIADMSDEILNTLTIVDNFRWGCEACIPADDPLCTGEVPDPKCCGVVEPQ